MHPYSIRLRIANLLSETEPRWNQQTVNLCNDCTERVTVPTPPTKPSANLHMRDACSSALL